ncbi:hypothetical protein EDM00_05670 [Ornithobacterium rhinotracheale]|nr:hypothetical protein [Ornithobacterium rhinotracheale]
MKILGTEKKNEIIYRIQILSSQKNYSVKSFHFKGLKNIYKIKENNLFKYYYGWYRDENQAKNNLKYLKIKKFPDAFIVKFKNGIKQ